MICIECCLPTETLFTTYSNNHIKLTDCSGCGKVVDKYVEFDSVILFIDLLLLKPQSYRHLVFNSLEQHLSQFTKVAGKRYTVIERARLWSAKYDRLNRIWLILITFEIYLKWAYEEKNTNRSATSFIILQETALKQYLMFGIQSLLDMFILHTMTTWLVRKMCNVSKDAVSYTILLSYGAKVFPILMLIWPYDMLSHHLTTLVANLYFVESLKIVTQLSYFQVLGIISAVNVTRHFTVITIMNYIIGPSN